MAVNQDQNWKFPERLEARKERMLETEQKLGAKISNQESRPITGEKRVVKSFVWSPAYLGGDCLV